jgi:hypothetical protein
MILFVALHESAYGPKRTWTTALHMSAFGGKADITLMLKMSAYDPMRTRNCPLIATSTAMARKLGFA